MTRLSSGGGRFGQRRFKKARKLIESEGQDSKDHQKYLFQIRKKIEEEIPLTKSEAQAARLYDLRYKSEEDWPDSLE